MAYTMPEKDPDALLDYGWDWSRWLAAGDTIAAHLVIAAPGIVLGPTAQTATSVTAWLSGGVARQRYPVTCRIETAQGREDDRTIVVPVGER